MLPLNFFYYLQPKIAPQIDQRETTRFNIKSTIENERRFHDLIGGIHVPVDDGVDKLNRKYTLLVFLFLALPIFTKQYIGDPIECFTPTYFTEPQARYVNSYCWTASTYYLVAADAEEDDYESFTGQVSVFGLFALVRTHLTTNIRGVIIYSYSLVDTACVCLKSLQIYLD